MVKKALFLVMLVILALGSTACFSFHVESDVDFPAARFSSAAERVAFLQSHNPDRVGRARKMHMLVYDGESRELVAGAVPLWLLRLGGERGEGHGPGRREEVASRYVDFDPCDLHELSRMGPGLLVQVDDLGDDTHVLLWLE
jgi:hypothetical protein